MEEIDCWTQQTWIHGKKQQKQKWDTSSKPMSIWITATIYSEWILIMGKFLKEIVELPLSTSAPPLFQNWSFAPNQTRNLQNNSRPV